MAEFNFKPPQLSDREWAVKLLAESDFRGCLYTFGNNYVWRNAYNAEICRFKDFYLLKNTDHTSGTPRFLYREDRRDDRQEREAVKQAGLNMSAALTAGQRRSNARSGHAATKYAVHGVHSVLSEFWVFQEKVDMKVSAFSFTTSLLVFGYL